MTIVARGERFTLMAYDRTIGRKRWIGTFDTREEAEEVRENLKKLPVVKCRVCRQKFHRLFPEQVRCSEACQAAKPVTRRTRVSLPLAERDHMVYVCCDGNGEVLYIGVSGAGIRRLHEHAREAAWWRDVATIKVEHLPSRDEALAREAELIATLKPLCNTLLTGRSQTTQAEESPCI